MGKKINELTSATPAAADLLEISRLSPTVTYTATTLSAQASDNSFNDSAAQFIAEGFAVGKSVNVTGFTGDAANNIFTGRITALTTSKMTIGGADGDVIVTDAAGESVTITAWESRRTTAQEVADLATTSGPTVASRYVIDLASQADGDPGAGKLRFNNATPTSATKIFLDDETSDGVDLSSTLLDLGASGYIRIQSVNDVGEWLYAKWTAITDDTGYFDIAITVLASKGTLDDTDAVLVTFDAKGSGGGSTQGKHDIWIPAGALVPALTNGCTDAVSVAQTAGRPDKFVMYFDQTTEQYAQCRERLPKSWNEGTVTVSFVWQQDSGGAGNVVWGAQAVACSDGDTLDAAFGTAQTVTDASSTTASVNHTSAETSAITVAGTPAARDLVALQVYRAAADGADTLAQRAGLIGVTLHYTTDADNDA